MRWSTRPVLNANQAVRAMLPADTDAVVRPDHLAGAVTLNRLPILEIGADGYLGATSIWPTIPQLAAKKRRKVNARRGDGGSPPGHRGGKKNRTAPRPDTPPHTNEHRHHHHHEHRAHTHTHTRRRHNTQQSAPYHADNMQNHKDDDLTPTTT